MVYLFWFWCVFGGRKSPDCQSQSSCAVLRIVPRRASCILHMNSYWLYNDITLIYNHTHTFFWLEQPQSWKALEKVHPVVVGVFCIIIFCGFLLCNIFNNGPTKKDPQPGDVSRRDLSEGGLGSFVTISVCWQIDVLWLFMVCVTTQVQVHRYSIYFGAVPAARVILVKSSIG